MDAVGNYDPAMVLGTIPLWAVIVRRPVPPCWKCWARIIFVLPALKGPTRMRVIIIHAQRNAMPPVVTVIGLQAGTLLLAGAILTETIFSRPGLDAG